MQNRISQEESEPFIFSMIFKGILTGIGVGLGFLIINTLKKAKR